MSGGGGTMPGDGVGGCTCTSGGGGEMLGGGGGGRLARERERLVLVLLEGCPPTFGGSFSSS